MNETQEADPTVHVGDEGPRHAALPVVRRTSGLGNVVKRSRVAQAVRQGLVPEVDPASDGADDRRTGLTSQPRSVVVIDNEPDQLELAVLLLQTAGHRTVGTTDGGDAVALVTGSGGEVVVLDFMLTGMTGCDVCDALRSDPTTRDVRIVILSGTPEREIRRMCTHYDAYLSKPVSSRALTKAIETV